MSGPTLESMLRDSLLRAQDGAPILSDVLDGVVRRRRAHRRVVAVLAVVVVAAIAAIAAPVAVSLRASGTQIEPSGGRPVATSIGWRTGRWPALLDETIGLAVVGSRAFVITRSAPGTVVRIDHGKTRKLTLAPRLTSGDMLSMVTNSKALYASDGQHIWRIDPATLRVAAKATVAEQLWRFAATDSGFYWSSPETAHRLDPQSLADRGSYELPLPATYLADDVVADGNGVAVVADAPLNKGSLVMPLSADLAPGPTTALPGNAGIGPWGSECGVNFFGTNRADDGTVTSTLKLSGLDPAAQAFTVDARVNGLGIDCATHRAYVELDQPQPMIEVFEPTASHRFAVTNRMLLPANEPVPRMLVSGGNLWLFGPWRIDRIDLRKTATTSHGNSASARIGG